MKSDWYGNPCRIRFLLPVLFFGFALLCWGCRQRITTRDMADTIVQTAGAADKENMGGQGTTQSRSDRHNDEKETQTETQMEEATQTGMQDSSAADTSSELMNTDLTSDQTDEAAPDLEKLNLPTGGGEGDSVVNRPDSLYLQQGTSPEEVMVYLDSVMGECSVESVTLYVGYTYGELPVPYRRGYDFQGWYTGRYGGSLVQPLTVVEDGNAHTLYARWTKGDGFTLQFDANGGRLKSQEKRKSVYSGEPYGTFPIPMRSGYEFGGWYDSPQGGNEVNETDIFNGGSDSTLYAHWNYNPYAYWSFMLSNITQQMYACQKKCIYIEFQDHVTKNDSTLISATSSINAAEYIEDADYAQDSWVKSKKPNVVIKCVSDMGNAAAYYREMSKRFSGTQVIVVDARAETGNDYERLYYQLYLGKMIYPDWYENVDMDKVSSDLGVTGSPYYN